MTTIMFFRKADLKVKISKAKVEAVLAAMVERKARTPRFQVRENVARFILSGEFARLPIVPDAILRDPTRRAEIPAGAGWAVPESDLGYSAGVVTESTVQSVRLWIKKSLTESAAGILTDAEMESLRAIADGLATIGVE